MIEEVEIERANEEVTLDEAERWEKYEQRKAMIPAGVSSSEYQRRCREIADELGI